ncbi:MAG: SMC-Scp complex subunit ScpB [Bacilli bacterium]
MDYSERSTYDPAQLTQEPGAQKQTDLKSGSTEPVGGALQALEGLLFAAGTEGLTDRQIAAVFDIDEALVKQMCLDLRDLQIREGRGFHIEQIADAWQLMTALELTPYLRQLALVPPPSALSQAALETLAIIAYRQPVTRAQIEDIRGVKSEKALGTLVARGLAQEIARAESPGRPFLYGTTADFLDYFGLGSARDLPPLEQQDDI